MKNYIVNAVFPASYTFTGSDRDASFYPSDDTELSFIVVNKGQGEKEVNFLKKNSLHVVRARLIPSGAEGLRAPEGKGAANIALSVVEDGNDVAAYAISFDKWGEWEKKDFHISLEGTGSFKLTAKTSSECRLDDFDILLDYIGQTVTPVLELEIESEGDALVDEDGRVY